MRAAYRIVPILALAAAPAGHAQQPTAQGGPAPAGALLGVTQGTVIGPQPGPDRPLPAVANPFGAEGSVLAEGRRLFVWFNCYGCHGGRAGGGMGPSLRDHVWLYGKTDQDIFNSIAEGRQHGMPAWGTKLPAEQLWKITAYIQSLGTPTEPDPPPANPVLPHLGPAGTVAKTPPLGGEK
ncbi:MAG TPA: c-type cytochrome [Gammaproteobacteria bacterium]|nr:c-type cytochrome [Gammaproteobacteria bacterium]